MIQSELDDLWDQTTACIMCGRVWVVHDPDEIPVCDRCGEKEEGAE